MENIIAIRLTSDNKLSDSKKAYIDPKNISKSVGSKRFKKTKIWSGIFIGNVLVVAVFLLILIKASSNHATSNINNASVSKNSINPLDQVSSSQIAQTVSTVVNLPETTAVKNQNETVSAEQSQSAAVVDVSAKPQIVATNYVSKDDIKTYTVQSGDTVSSVAAKFNITSNSILWSNNLSGSSLSVGSKILVPPVSGIVYTVKSGDTLSSLATKYGSNIDQLTAYNDAELKGIQPGEQILIPNGQPPAAPVYNFFVPTYGSGSESNGYDFGYCTWYVATQISVPSNWGNASSWAYYAGLSGWNVSSVPSVGAIAQTPYASGGEGHVAVVIGVNGDQVEIRDMNNYGDGGGWDRVGQGWVSASTFPNYLTK